LKGVVLSLNQEGALGHFFNRIPVIRTLEVRDMVFFTSKKYVLIKSKTAKHFEYRNGHLFQSKLIQPLIVRGIKLMSVYSNQLEVTTDLI
jgi:hypothetical protein